MAANDPSFLIAPVSNAAHELCLIVAEIEMGTIERPEFAGIDHKFNKYTFATYTRRRKKSLC